MRRLLAAVAIGLLAVLSAACGTTSVTSASGNLKTCDDFVAYGSYVQSIKTQPPPGAVHRQLQQLEQALEVDGPTAQSQALAETAKRAVQAIKANTAEAVANEMNASTTDCSALGHLPPGASVSGQG